MKVIGTNRREGIDWIQDKLGPMCPRTTAEATFLGLVKEGQIVGCKNALILTEDVGQEDLRLTADKEVKKRMRSKVRKAPPRSCKHHHSEHHQPRHKQEHHHRHHGNNNEFDLERDQFEDDGDLGTVNVPNSQGT
jgi:hypothetical protein